MQNTGNPTVTIAYAIFSGAGFQPLDRGMFPRSRGALDHRFSVYFAALAARIASVSMGVTLNRSPQMP